jgi:hypothetical protein
MIFTAQLVVVMLHFCISQRCNGKKGSITRSGVYFLLFARKIELESLPFAGQLIALRCLAMPVCLEIMNSLTHFSFKSTRQIQKREISLSYL